MAEPPEAIILYDNDDSGVLQVRLLLPSLFNWRMIMFKFLWKKKEAIFWITLAVILLGIIIVYRKPIVEALAEDSRSAYQYRQELRKHIFEPGDKVVLPGGAKGTINKECWFSFNNYEVRLENGTMSMVRGGEMQGR